VEPLPLLPMQHTASEPTKQKRQQALKHTASESFAMRLAGAAPAMMAATSVQSCCSGSSSVSTVGMTESRSGGGLSALDGSTSGHTLLGFPAHWSHENVGMSVAPTSTPGNSQGSMRTVELSSTEQGATAEGPEVQCKGRAKSAPRRFNGEEMINKLGKMLHWGRQKNRV
jgi:hypothetical protein